MKRRTLLKSLGLGLCTALLGLWPDLGGSWLRPVAIQVVGSVDVEGWDRRGQTTAYDTHGVVIGRWPNYREYKRHRELMGEENIFDTLDRQWRARIGLA